MSLDVKFGVSTWLWTSPFNTASIGLFPKIKEMGYDVVEIPVEDPGLIETGKIKAALIASDLQAVICGAFGPSTVLTHDDPAYHKTSFEYILSCLDICSLLGAGCLAGPIDSAGGKSRLVSGEQREKE